MDYFKLTRSFWDFAFENPEKIKPNHCALYLFIVEHCNRLGWKKKFGLPTTMAKDAIGIRSYGTYIVTLNDLVSFGLIELIEKSKNQYSSNIVAVSNFDKALDKSLDKATLKHVSKQGESIDSINKPITNNNQTIEERKANFANSLKPYLKLYGADMLNDFYSYWTEHGEKDKKFRSEKQTSFSIERRLETWKRNDEKFKDNKKIGSL